MFLQIVLPNCDRLLGILWLFLNSLKRMVSHEAIILFEKAKQKRFGQRTWGIMVPKTNENEQNDKYENKNSFTVSVHSDYWIHLYILKWEWNYYSIYYIMTSIHVLNDRRQSYVQMFWADELLLYKQSFKREKMAKTTIFWKFCMGTPLGGLSGGIPLAWLNCFWKISGGQSPIWTQSDHFKWVKMWFFDFFGKNRYLAGKI